MLRADVVVCGAGMAGVAAAYHLSVRHGIRNVVIVDDREPFTLTSDKGTQGYRNWFPGPDGTMVRFMNRSIDLIEELADATGNAFNLTRPGYLFLTADSTRARALRTEAEALESLGAGPARIHGQDGDYVPTGATSYRDVPTGSDVLLDPALIRGHFPWVTDEVLAALHVRRAGFFESTRLGHWMMEQARTAGARFVQSGVERFDVTGGAVRGVHLRSGERLATDRVVIAAGPYLPAVANLLGIELPVFHELHAKLTLRDRLHVIPRTAPFTIWTDPVTLPWRLEERERLAAADETRWMVEPFPGGVHMRPVDHVHPTAVYIIWTYETAQRHFEWPPRFDPNIGELLVRGLSAMIPGMRAYFGEGHAGLVDGGFYCKTRENRPLVGPLPVEGAYVIGALSGYGIMSSHAAADLLAAHVTQGVLPEYARWFLPSRYDDPAYRALLDGWDARVGQI
jgi:glycine/D-amino acid oxidase-like deaminating enzyme